MASVFKIKFDEVINDDTENPNCGESKTVAADNAEQAIEKLRKNWVGKSWGDTIDHPTKPGKTKKVTYRISSIAVQGVEPVCDLDIA